MWSAGLAASVKRIAGFETITEISIVTSYRRRAANAGASGTGAASCAEVATTSGVQGRSSNTRASTIAKARLACVIADATGEVGRHICATRA